MLNPALMSAGVQVHPLLVLFGVLAGAEIAGVRGIFFSVPVIAALRLILVRLRRRTRVS
jgi:predicted PurR-regulated permease PerM